MYLQDMVALMMHVGGIGCMNSQLSIEVLFVGNLKKKASFKVLLDVSGLGYTFILLHGIHTRHLVWLR